MEARAGTFMAGTVVAGPADTGEAAGSGAGHHNAPVEGWSSCRQAAGRRSLDDTALVARAIGTAADTPDAEAFGVLYERHAHSVFALAFGRMHNVAQAEDITSQTFLQAFEAFPRYQHRGLPIRNWFSRIAINLIVGMHRASPGMPAREPDGGAPVQDLPDPGAEAAIAAWEGAEEFRRLVDVLPPGQRTVLRLRFADGLPIAAIAGRTGRSAGAVRALQARGLRTLRLRWEPGGARGPRAGAARPAGLASAGAGTRARRLPHGTDRSSYD